MCQLLSTFIAAVEIQKLAVIAKCKITQINWFVLWPYRPYKQVVQENEKAATLRDLELRTKVDYGEGLEITPRKEALVE